MLTCLLVSKEEYSTSLSCPYSPTEPKPSPLSKNQSLEHNPEKNGPFNTATNVEGQLGCNHVRQGEIKKYRGGLCPTVDENIDCMMMMKDLNATKYLQIGIVCNKKLSESHMVCLKYGL